MRRLVRHVILPWLFLRDMRVCRRRVLFILKLTSVLRRGDILRCLHVHRFSSPPCKLRRTRVCLDRPRKVVHASPIPPNARHKARLRVHAISFVRRYAKNDERTAHVVHHLRG